MVPAKTTGLHDDCDSWCVVFRVRGVKRAEADCMWRQLSVVQRSEIVGAALRDGEWVVCCVPVLRFGGEEEAREVREERKVEGRPYSMLLGVQSGLFV